MSRYTSATDADRKAMLEAIGAGSIDDLFADIPEGVRLDRPIDLPRGLSEQEVYARLRELARRNVSTEDEISFLGAGMYDHYVPGLVEHVIERSEFLTPYTPYQPEISQGGLQVMFEYQTAISELTALPVSNASVYEGPSAVAAAGYLAKLETKRHRLVASRGLHPHSRAALVTHAAGYGMEVVEAPLDDAWLRDSGPTFVRRHDGAVVAVDWVFNGWGAQPWAAWGRDEHLGRFVAATAGTEVWPSTLTNEGGGFHVDGDGTVLLTETVQLDPGRNPGLTKQEVEAELHARLGTTTAIWLPRGLTRDYEEFGTRGHVDIVAAFAGPGIVLVHRQEDPRHPDFEVSRQVRSVLEEAVDARGRRLRVIDVPAPTVLDAGDGFVDWSYINHYVTNGAVVLCAFDDPHDAGAARILAEAYPGRRIELVDARDIFAFGGGIHCITQQQPAPVPSPGEAAR